MAGGQVEGQLDRVFSPQISISKIHSIVNEPIAS